MCRHILAQRVASSPLFITENGHSWLWSAPSSQTVELKLFMHTQALSRFKDKVWAFFPGWCLTVGVQYKKKTLQCKDGNIFWINDKALIGYKRHTFLAVNCDGKTDMYTFQPLY